MKSFETIYSFLSIAVYAPDMPKRLPIKGEFAKLLEEFINKLPICIRIFFRCHNGPRKKCGHSCTILAPLYFSSFCLVGRRPFVSLSNSSKPFYWFREFNTFITFGFAFYVSLNKIII
jgi:hypothetical protein